MLRGKTKNKNDINSLRRIVAALRDKEIIVLKDQLHPKKTNSKPKPLKLLEVVQKHPKASETDIKKKVSPDSSQPAFSMLIGTLKKKIFDSLLVDVNLNRKGVYPSWYQVCFESNKQLMAARIMFRRGLQDDVENLLDSIIERTKKLEIYDTLIEAMVFLFVISGNRGKQVKHLESEIEYYKRCKSLVDKAWMLHTKITAIDQYHSDEFEQAELEKLNAELQLEFSLYPSDNLWYWNNINSVYFLQEKREYEKVDLILQQVLLKLHKSEAISMSRRIAATLLRLADNCIYLKNFDDCYNYSQQALTLFEEGTYNHCLALEMSFTSKFHLRDYGKAHVHIRSLTSVDHRKVSAFNLARWSYYKAATFVFRNNFEGAANLLAQTSALDVDKEGWNISVRVLEIIVQIESNKLSHIADQKVLNLIAFAKGKKISKRNKLIIDVLRSLRKTGYKFKEVQSSCMEELRLLGSKAPYYCWKISSPEIIRFDAWFMSKLNNMEYSYDLELT